MASLARYQHLNSSSWVCIQSYLKFVDLSSYQWRSINIGHLVRRRKRELRLVRFLNLENPKLRLADVPNPDLTEEFTSKLSLTSNDPIYCSIEHHPLEDIHKQYTALSYTWGPRTPTKRLTVKESGGEKAVAITENLHSALHHIGFSIPVWIDSVHVF